MLDKARADPTSSPSKPSVKQVRRGRPKLLTKQKVLDAAHRIVQTEGVDALSMPRLGRELGIATMTVYGYVSNKQELLDDLVDLMISDVPALKFDPTIPWRQRIEMAFKDYRAHLLRKPAIVKLLASRPLAPKASFARAQSLIEELQEGGLSREAALDGYLTLFTYTLGFVSWEQTRLHDQTPAEFKQDMIAELQRAERPYPLLVELAERAARDPQKLYEFGLRRILESLEWLATQTTRAE